MPDAARFAYPVRYAFPVRKSGSVFYTVFPASNPPAPARLTADAGFLIPAALHCPARPGVTPGNYIIEDQ